MKRIIKNKKAEGFIDSGVKILIAVVIGALLLGGVYTIFSNNIFPSTQTKVESLFDYGGENVEAKFVTFYVAGKECQAKENMTWEEWVNSEYNTLGYSIKDSQIVKPGGIYLSYKKDNPVNKTDTITENFYYLVGFEKN